MRQTFWSKWRHRISGAWQVLTGQAFAAYYFDDCMQKYWRPDLSRLGPDGFDDDGNDKYDYADHQ